MVRSKVGLLLYGELYGVILFQKVDMIQFHSGGI